jgi:hypothetical protein
VSRLALERDAIVGHRRRVGLLDERAPLTAANLRLAAWAGLADSMPRAALLSLHARVAGVQPDSWEHPSLVQLWGPRFSDYVVAAEDHVIFGLGRLPDEPKAVARAHDMAERLHTFLAGRRMPYGEAGRAIGVHPNMLRYGTATGRIFIRWAGARQPLIWTIPMPAMDPIEARLELARRYLHVMGPGTAAGFSNWAGIRAPRARSTMERLEAELVPISSPAGEGWILATDERSFRAPPDQPAPARLLPSGDTFFLYWGADRGVVVPDAKRRPLLWTSRVWPGAVLVAGEVAGTWRRAGGTVDIDAWRTMTAAERAAVEAEATSFPLADVGPIRVRWS